MKKEVPNPTGRHGKPIILAPTTFEDAVKGSKHSRAIKAFTAKEKALGV